MESLPLGFMNLPLDYDYIIYPAGFLSFTSLIIVSLLTPPSPHGEVATVLGIALPVGRRSWNSLDLVGRHQAAESEFSNQRYCYTLKRSRSKQDLEG